MKEKIKAVFFNETLRRWHFEDILRETGVSRERVNHFLKKLIKGNFIQRMKPRGKMPYYIANRDLPKFRFEKRLYGLKLLEQTGLFGHLSLIKDVKSAILFGSFARGDWSKSSDVDLFIYGNANYIKKGKFETKLNREIQLFSYQDTKKMKKELDPKLIPNIIGGFNIKGRLDLFKVGLNA